MVPTQKEDKSSLQIGKELLFLQLGWVGIGSMTALGIYYHDAMTPAVKDIMMGLGLATLGLTTIPLARILFLVINSQQEIEKNKNIHLAALKILKEPISPELIEETKKLPSNLTANFTPMLTSGKTEHIVSDSNNGIKNYIPDNVKKEMRELIIKRWEALTTVVGAINPLLPWSRQPLKGLASCFPLVTSDKGIKLLPSEKSAVIWGISMLPVIPVEQFFSSDYMVQYYIELARIYTQILKSYSSKLSVNSNLASTSIYWENLEKAIKAEKFTGQLVSPPITDHKQRRELELLEKNRSLLSDEDAITMAKALVSIWFRAIPEAQIEAGNLISQLKNEISNLNITKLLKEEVVCLELLKKILRLPNQWPKLTSLDQNLGNVGNLQELIKRLERVTREENVFLAKFRGEDKTPRGRILYQRSHGGISVKIDLQDPKNSCLVISSENEFLSATEEVAICLALIFPGIKNLQLKLKDRIASVPLAEFYLERIINQSTGYLRQLLRSASFAVTNS